MAGNTPTTLASRLKEQYNGDISTLVPGNTELVKLKFRKDIETGKAAVFDVSLSDELGFSVGQGSVSLLGNIPQQAAKATVEGFSLILQSLVSYDLITRANSERKAFASFASGKFLNMTDSFQRRQEILHCWGREGLGKVTANTAGTNETVLTISEDSWCPTLWLGLKGSVLEAFTAKTGGTQHNGDLTVKSVNVVNRTVTVTATGNAYSAVAANDHLFFKGTHDAGHIGLMSIAKNQSTLFGIDASVYELWKGNSYDVGTSALTLGKLLQAAALAANKGCNEDLKALVPVKTFQSLVSDEAALRQYNATSYSKEKAENGFKRISFAGASGDIEVIPYHFMKEGEAVLFPPKWTYLLGSSEMTMSLAKDGDMIFDVYNSSDKELRLYSDMQLFVERPGYLTYLSRSDGKALHA
jgi:hypothetical protein